MTVTCTAETRGEVVDCHEPAPLSARHDPVMACKSQWPIVHLDDIDVHTGETAAFSALSSRSSGLVNTGNNVCAATRWVTASVGPDYGAPDLCRYPEREGHPIRRSARWEATTLAMPVERTSIMARSKFDQVR